MKNSLKKKLRIASVVMASILVTVSVSGCSLFPKKEVQTAPKVITIWGFESEDLWQPLIKDPVLQKETGGFEIKYVKKNLDDVYENNALNSILSGQGPDVWAVPNDWVYRHKNKLYPAPSDLIISKQLLENKVPSIIENNYINDQLIAYSPGVDTLMLYYNPAIIKEASTEHQLKRPEQHSNEYAENYEKREDVIKYNQEQTLINTPPDTWADFIKSNQLITKRSGTSIIRSGCAMGTANNTAYSAEIIYLMMLQNKIKIVNDTVDLATFNLPTATASGQSEISGKYILELYTSFSNSSSENYSWNDSMGSNLDAFATGKAAYIIAPGSAKNFFTQKYPNFEFKNTAIPQASPNEEMIHYARFYSYVVPKASPFPEIAWRIASSAPQNTTIYTNTSVEPNYSSQKNNETNIYQKNFAHTWTKGRYPVEVDKIFRSAIDDVLNGKQSSENAINTAATKVTELLRKTEW